MESKRILKDAIIDYETIPYRVKSVLDNSFVEITPIRHKWETEIILLSQAEPIEITEPFLLANNFKKNKSGSFDYIIKYSVGEFILTYNLDGSGRVIFNHNYMWPRSVLEIHELQLLFAALNIKHEFIFKKQFYKSNL
jgi:hypothetical protein